MAPQPITLQALNRATLARQHLLERTTLDAVEVAGAVGGLQAQEPASPFIALWSRVAGFEADALVEAFTQRRIVKATLMRGTLHAVPAPDYRRLAPAMAPLIDGAMARASRGVRPSGATLARFRASALELTATPRRNSELRDLLGTIDDGHDLEASWWWVRRHVPLLHAPVAAPWAFDRRPWLVSAEAWLAGDGGVADETTGTRHLVTRYLAAFGPATVADAASWSRLPVSRLRPAFDALDAEGALIRLADEAGRTLLDLVDAPRPDPATPSPPRLLPMWDSVLLAHADRSRIIGADERRQVVDVNGDTYPTFLVDGRVAGLWWATAEGGTTRIDLEPFAPLRPADREALEGEAEALARFLGPREPDAYRRYRVGRARRLARG